MRSVSVVAPAFNEAESILRPYEGIAQAASRMPDRWEFVFVDDGSCDGTWDALLAVHAQDARVRPIRLKRNFGQTPALACGIDHARKNGDGVLLMSRRRDGGRAAGLVVTPLGLRDVEIAADLSGEEVVHFAVARDR